MSGDDFERQLQRAFAEAPSMPDEALFAASVQSRLDHGETVRRLVIGALGGLGAVIATAQLVSAGVAGRATQMTEGAEEAMRFGWSALSRDASALMATTPMGGEMLWTVAALGAAAIALLATRFAGDGV